MLPRKAISAGSAVNFRIEKVSALLLTASTKAATPPVPVSKITHDHGTRFWRVRIIALHCSCRRR